jgi:hypothetical protein
VILLLLALSGNDLVPNLFHRRTRHADETKNNGPTSSVWTKVVELLEETLQEEKKTVARPLTSANPPAPARAMLRSQQKTPPIGGAGKA